MKIHESLTPDRVCDGARRTTFDLENVGFCVACGEEACGCEPDAQKYRCESCGKHAVYGAEELVFHLVA